MVPLKKKVLQYGTPKPSLAFRIWRVGSWAYIDVIDFAQRGPQIDPRAIPFFKGPLYIYT